ncbi:MAG: hypothetical protein MUF59_08905 [Candidatus Krumholzibacteria bacterium]|jgi:hypothetical protein|nr:hypothetical protein [Candidatus Krumholzibacteria bacterium]
METPKSVYKLGFWSAFFAAFFSIAYVIGQLAEWFGLMGSGGGPENDSTWYGLVVLLVPSLFIGISFVVMMGSIHSQAPADKKIWSQTGLIFAIMYGTLICMNYFVQLTLVAPALYRGEVSDGIRPFLFNVFNSFTYSVDLLGYSFMSLATLFAAFVFTGPGLEKAVRWFMIANGLIMPFIALQTFYHPLIWVASLWAVTLPGATVSLAVLFRRKLRGL